MFLTREELIIRDVKKILCGLGCASITFVIICLMMLMFAKNNEMSNWFYGLFGM